MAEPKSRIVLRVFAVLIACMFFAVLATGLIRGMQLHQIVLQCGMMIVFLVFGLFGLKPAETLLGIFIPTQRTPPIVLGLPVSPKETSPTPASIGNAKVIAFTAVDQRHHPTGACRHVVAGELLGPVAGLAICKYEADPGYYLFYCDHEWHTITDTYHDSVEAAKHQAEFEYTGVSSTWQHLEESR